MKAYQEVCKTNVSYVVRSVSSEVMSRCAGVVARFGKSRPGCGRAVQVRALVFDRPQHRRLRVLRPGVAPGLSLGHIQRVRSVRFARVTW